MLWLHAYGRSIRSLHALRQRDRHIPCATLKDSVKYMRGHRTGSCGFHTGLGAPIRLCMRAPCEPVLMPYTGLGISVSSVVPGRIGLDAARECTFVLYLPGKT